MNPSTNSTYQEATFRLLKLLHRIGHPPIQSLTHTPTNLSILNYMIQKYPLLVSMKEPGLLHGAYSDQRFVEKLWHLVERDASISKDASQQNRRYHFPLRVQDFLQGERFILKRIELFVDLERILKFHHERIQEERKRNRRRKEGQTQRPKSSAQRARKGSRGSASAKLKDHFKGQRQKDLDTKRAPQQSSLRRQAPTPSSNHPQTEKDESKTNLYNGKDAETARTLHKYKLKETDDIRRQRAHNDKLDEALQDLDRYTEKLDSLEKTMDSRWKNFDEKFHALDSKFENERQTRMQQDFESMMFGEEANPEFASQFDEMKRIDQERMAKKVHGSKMVGRQTAARDSTRQKARTFGASSQSTSTPSAPIDDSEISALISKVRHNLDETNAFITYCKENTLSR